MTRRQRPAVPGPVGDRRAPAAQGAQGRGPAVRVERPHAPYFRYAGPGALSRARRRRSRERRPAGRSPACATWSSAGRSRTRRSSRSGYPRRRPCASSARTRSARRPTRPRRSCGYFLVAGAGALLVSVEVAIAIAILLAVVSVSYRQVCRAYPNGGGAYVVARTNLAPLFGLIAAASLLIDYVMTVAVSTAAAITQIQSVIPQAYDYRILIAFVSIGAHHHRQPARPARVREHLRGADVPVRRARPRDRGHRRWSGSCRATRGRSRLNPTRCRSGRRRSACSCCSRRSRADRSR